MRSGVAMSQGGKSSGRRSKIAVALCAHDDHWFLRPTLESFAPAGPCLVYVSRVPWSGLPGDWERVARLAQDAGAQVVLGDWASENEHRKAAYDDLIRRGYTWALVPDGDEVVEAGLLDHLLRVAKADLADRVYVEWNTYWKSPEYVVRPREPFHPLILFNLRRARQVHIRHYEGGRGLLLPAEYGLIHHLSYAGPDERILRKVTSWSHKDELVPGWWERVWKGWDHDKLKRFLHPTHPDAYGFIERVPLAPELAGIDASWMPDRHASNGARPKLPKTSVVVPLYGGPKHIEACLKSLGACRDLLHEVIVVDDCSPDDAAQVAASFDFVRLVRRRVNGGFAAACNTGLVEATGEVVLFLNSDTVVPRAGLQALLGGFTSGSVAALGPQSNNAGHGQQIDPTYTSLGTLELFAEDHAASSAAPYDVDMLVGLALAVRRSVLDEVGGFDERFGSGLFEDNDLCYRIRRAGYRLQVVPRAYVHHEGSQTIGKLPGVPEIFESNRAKYQAKWQEDIELGFASHLSGLSAEPVRFDEQRRPEALKAQMARRAAEADISLCMIVRNEERVLEACLASAKPFFREMLVVDTGSTDRTVEIAKRHGALVSSIEWPESFALARNESLKFAGGRWIFWMDADDTLPFASGQALVEAALSAPDDVVGFVVPVQFVEEGPGGGTRVDHVKLFRNFPGVEFEGRIHEQVLPSLRVHGGQIARLEAVVLHSGYDTSPEGQARKRERDDKLLKLDLAERPGHPFVLFNLGMTAHYAGEHEEAVDWLSKSIAAAQPSESHVRKAYALLGVSMRELGRLEDALATFEDGLLAVGQDAELHFHRGLVLTQLGRTAEAICAYEQVLGVDMTGHFTSLDTGIFGYKTLHNLGMLHGSQGDYPKCRQCLEEAMERSPSFLPSAFELFDRALEAGDLATARKCAELVGQREGQSQSWVEMSVKLAEHLGGPENAEMLLRQAAPQSIPAARRLARFLAERGREAEALPLWYGLQSAGDAESAYFLGVSAIRSGRYGDALDWMERAHELNPEHEQTIQQRDRLREALAKEEARV